jgi:flavin reductase (DIM6/NTAB) family NADH-FMN oxidoreductase RutF
MQTNILKLGPYPTLVAVVTTMYRDVVNAAPITWFTPCSYDPPMMLICVKRGSDTLENILDTSQFVLQTVPYYDAFDVHRMAKKLPRGKSEIENMATYKSEFVIVTRLFIAQQWYECVTSKKYISTVGKTHVQIVGQIMNETTDSFSEHTNTLLYCGGLTYTCDGQDCIDVEPY